MEFEKECLNQQDSPISTTNLLETLRQKRQSTENRSEKSFHFKFLFLCVTLLIGIIYCQFSHDKLLEKCHAGPFTETLQSFFFSFTDLYFNNISGSIFRLLKSIAAGLLAVYYSWEIIYLDSMTPGIQPVSPLSPSRIRAVSGKTSLFDLNHLLAAVNGVFFGVIVFCWT